MKYSITIAVHCILTIAVVYAQGLEEQDGQQELCNIEIDDRLLPFGYIYHILSLENPACDTCYMQNFASIKRTGDVHLKKTSENTFLYSLPLTFTDLKEICVCNDDTGSFKTNQFHQTWPNPRFTADFEANKSTGLTVAKGIRIDSSHHDMPISECTGTPAWRAFCNKSILPNRDDLQNVLNAIMNSESVKRLMFKLQCDL